MLAETIFTTAFLEQMDKLIHLQSQILAGMKVLAGCRFQGLLQGQPEELKRSGRAVVPMVIGSGGLVRMDPLGKTVELKGLTRCMKYFCYVLKSVPFGTYYYGSTGSLERLTELYRGVAERSNAAVLKTVELKGSGGSNPSSSAEYQSNRSKTSNS